MPAPAKAPHVLYVAWGYPPSRGGGVYRALATANAFAKQGFEVTVLTATRESFMRYTGADTSLEALIDPRITVVRVPFEWPIFETDLREWSAHRAFFPRRWRKRQDAADKAIFPEVGYGAWRVPLEREASRIHAERPIDLVVATANPNVDLAVADHLHRTAQVPYVVDYRDAWLLDVFTGDQIHPDDSDQAEWERRLMTHALEAWFVNEPIAQWHQRRYPEVADRMHVVANGYDAETAPEPRVSSPPAERSLRFGYIGTVSNKVPLRQFIAGWARAREDDPEIARASAEIWGYLGFYSTPSAPLVTLLADAAKLGVTYEGPLPKQRVKEVYEEFDALLLLLGPGIYVTSGKIFEYAASALPIVAIHDPGNAATSVLRDYPLWFPVADMTSAVVAEALVAAADAARNASEEVREQCRAFAQRYSRDLQLLPRIEALAASVPVAQEVVR